MSMFKNLPPERRALVTFLLILPLAGIAGIILLLSNSGAVGMGASGYQFNDPQPEQASSQLVGKGFDFVDNYGAAPKAGATRSNGRTVTTNGQDLGGGYSVPNVGSTSVRYDGNGSVRTLAAANVTTNAATLSGKVQGADAEDTWFVVSRTNTNPTCNTTSLQTTSTGSQSSGGTFTKRITLTRDDETYHFRACANMDGVTVSGDVKSLHTLTEVVVPDAPKVLLHFSFVSASCSATGALSEVYSVKAESAGFSGPVTIAIQSNSGSLISRNLSLVEGTQLTLGNVTTPGTYPWASLSASTTRSGATVLSEVSKDTPTQSQLPSCTVSGDVKFQYLSSSCQNGARFDSYRADARVQAPAGVSTIRFIKNGSTLHTMSNMPLTTTGWTPLGTVSFNSQTVPTPTGLTITGTTGQTAISLAPTLVNSVRTTLNCTVTAPVVNVYTPSNTVPTTASGATPTPAPVVVTPTPTSAGTTVTNTHSTGATAGTGSTIGSPTVTITPSSTATTDPYIPRTLVR